MHPEIERDGDSINIGGDFLGTAIDSPTGAYTLAYGILLGNPQCEDRFFYLIDGAHILCHGKTDHRICDARVGQSGHFVLIIHGSERAEAAIFYDLQGRVIRREVFQTDDYWNLLGMTSGGKNLFREGRGRLFVEELSTGQILCEFKLPDGFNANIARGEDDADEFDLCHRGMEWFRFNRSGNLLQPTEFRAFRIAHATGPELFGIAQSEFKGGDRTDPERINEAIRLIEQAFERGIEDSFYLHRSEAYTFLAHLHHIAGHSDLASSAKMQAEATLDGFRLVDRALRQAPEARNEGEICAVLAALERALRTPRLHNYPNYLVKLYRCRGELCERLGDSVAAIEAYETALRHNPKAGCKRQLAKLCSMTAISAPSVRPPRSAIPKQSSSLVRTILAALARILH
jgi:tetratricopeptide (TPR) repeat protein